MIDIRCPRCSKTVDTLELDKTTSFSEQWAKENCKDCKERIKNSDPEEKLKNAILGRRIYQGMEEET